LLRRLLIYSEKVYKVRGALGTVKDARRQGRIATELVVAGFLLLFWADLGSLNALEQGRPSGYGRTWLGGAMCSAKTMGRVAATLELDDVRALLRRHHRKRKRNKGLRRGARRFRFLILDGHEGVSSYKRWWAGCLERVVRFATGQRTQYYFRYVGAYLTNGRERLVLDAERQRPGEGEIETAMRLLERLFREDARAFDVVCGDALYLNPTLWKLVRKHKKHIIAVVKSEARDLLVDARSLFNAQQARTFKEGKTTHQWWDLEGFTTWPQCGEPVRVVRSVERTWRRAQKTGDEELHESEWLWATSLPQSMAPTSLIVQAGHGRWDIENRLFNELGTYWHGDHAYKYDANALMACLLLLFLAYNLFHAFVTRNLKPQLRQRYTQKHIRHLLAADFYHIFSPLARPRPP